MSTKKITMSLLESNKIIIISVHINYKITILWMLIKLLISKYMTSYKCFQKQGSFILSFKPIEIFKYTNILQEYWLSI